MKQLICEGIHRSISESQLFREAGRHYEPNFQSALRSLIDEGIVMVLESHRLKKYLVNFDMIDVAQSIINSQSKLNRIKVIQPFMPEPEGFIYWFDNNQEDRKYRRQNIYRFYTSKTDRMEFAAQLITQSMSRSRTLYMGSLNNSNSYIYKIWRAALVLSDESEDGTFILQDLQDRERVACGNNRQRGKIGIAIFKKLGYIQEISTKGNSTRFKITGRKPFSVTLDEIFTVST
ncbi:MAG: hypothetical protein WA461_09420 [Nitrososphaeraceae archaeon]